LYWYKANIGLQESLRRLGWTRQR